VCEIGGAPVPLKGQKHTAAARARMSEGVKRGSAARLRGLAITGRAIRAYIRTGKGAPGIRQEHTERIEEAGHYAADLGGDLTTGERIWLSKLIHARTITGVSFRRFYETGDASVLEGLAPWLAEERAALAALGLKRRARPVLGLAEYLSQRSSEPPMLDVDPGDACTATAESEVEVGTEVRAEPGSDDGGSNDG